MREQTSQGRLPKRETSNAHRKTGGKRADAPLGSSVDHADVRYVEEATIHPYDVDNALEKALTLSTLPKEQRRAGRPRDYFFFAAASAALSSARPALRLFTRP
jgi:hypothetical protein